MLHDTEAPDALAIDLAHEIKALRSENDQVGWQLAALRGRMTRADATMAIIRNAVRDYDAVRGDERANELEALRESVRAAVVAIESGAIFDWYQRDALLRRLRDHVDNKR